MSEQTADMLERALRRDHSGWPLVMPSDLLALVENFRHKSQRIADLERERALLLRYVRAQEEMDHADYDTMTDAEADRIGYGVRDARAALIDAGLLGG